MSKGNLDGSLNLDSAVLRSEDQKVKLDIKQAQN